MSGRPAACAALLFVAACGSAPARPVQHAAPPPQEQDRVVATVDGTEIRLSALDLRAAPFLRSAARPAGTSNADVVRQVLREMILDVLVERQAAREEITIAPALVDQAIEELERENQMSDAAFWRTVRAQGFDEESYRANVRMQLLRLRLASAHVPHDFDDDAVHAEYDRRVASSPGVEIPPFAQVADQLRQQLAEQALSDGMPRYLESLKAHANITIVDGY